MLVRRSGVVNMGSSRRMEEGKRHDQRGKASFLRGKGGSSAKA